MTILYNTATDRHRLLVHYGHSPRVCQRLCSDWANSSTMTRQSNNNLCQRCSIASRRGNTHFRSICSEQWVCFGDPVAWAVEHRIVNSFWVIDRERTNLFHCVSLNILVSSCFTYFRQKVVWRKIRVKHPALNALLTMRQNTLHAQYNTIQYNTIQYNAIQYNAMQYNTMQCNAMQIQYSTVQYNTIRYDTITMQYSTIQYNQSLLSLSRTLFTVGCKQIQIIYTLIFTLDFIRIHVY